MLWDVFISHASEDKRSVARPLAAALEAAGLRVWIDEAQLRLGDSLRAKLDEGLSQSRYGVVILSRSFFAKQWPQRELSALFSRRDAILPVWHGLSSSEINEISPLLADIVAVTTSEGIDSVALKVLDVAGKHLPSRRIGSTPYTSELSVPLERIGRALEVIDSLGNEATWSQLQIDAPGYPSSGWMGSNSSTLIEIVYGFAAPLVAYRRLSYSVRRNLALLDAQTRLHFALLESAFDLFTNEAALAAVAPPIDYSPRVPRWRVKRIDNPARYWWQGISPERFDAALPFFLHSGESADDTNSLVSAEGFVEVYRRSFESGDEKIQQAIGLLANGFYGFTPSSRPVLWRVCVGLARIYHALLGNSQFDLTMGSAGSFETVYQPRDESCFPFDLTVRPLELYEPFSQTLEATLQYLEVTSLPRIRTYLATPRERGSVA